MVFVIAFTWMSMFAASKTWEFVVAGAITVACIAVLLRRRSS